MQKMKFNQDVEGIRKRAREHVENGAVTEGYPAERASVIKMLNDALATELLCVLRYRFHYFMVRGIHSEPVAAEFLEHSNEEQTHADQLAERIVQLGGKPNFNPDTISSRSHAEFVDCDTPEEMVRENLVAERIAIDSYRGMIEYIGMKDPTTRRMLEEILAKEEEHADDLANLMDGMS